MSLKKTVWLHYIEQNDNSKSPQILWPGLQCRAWFLPMGQASDPPRKWLVAPIAVTPLLHQWAHLALQVSIANMQGPHLGRTVDISLPAAHIAPSSIMKASRHRGSFWLSANLICHALHPESVMPLAVPTQFGCYLPFLSINTDSEDGTRASVLGGQALPTEPSP